MAKKKKSPKLKKKQKAFDHRKRRKEQRKSIEGLTEAIREIEYNPVHRADKTYRMLLEKLIEDAQASLGEHHVDD